MRVCFVHLYVAELSGFAGDSTLTNVGKSRCVLLPKS